MNNKNMIEEKVEEKPTLQFSVLCDGVATPKETGNKPVLIGVFSNLLRPMIIPQFFIANRWINGLGEHNQTIKILDPELNEIAKVENQKFILASKVNSADIFCAFVNLNFAKSGVFWVKIELDNKTALSYPIPVFATK